jgi:hypothetical protein
MNWIKVKKVAGVVEFNELALDEVLQGYSPLRIFTMFKPLKLFYNFLKHLHPF